MPKGPAKGRTRDLVTQALTTQRVFVSCWALGAIFAGSMGLAAYNFGTGRLDLNTYAGVRLPPPGDVSTTASIGRDDIQVYPSQRSQFPQNTSHINALQSELATLRMRLTTLAQQNERYSARIAKLESQASLPQGPGLAKSPDGGAGDNQKPAAVKTPMQAKTGPEPARTEPKSASETLPHRKVETLPAPETLTGQAFRRGNPEQTAPLADVSGTLAPKHAEASKPDPVRFAVNNALLPPVDGTPSETGSIPQQDVPDPEAKPSLVVPGQASGRVSGSEGTSVRRTDFAVIVGHFKDESAAKTAWRNFEHQNADRMRGMQARLMPSELNPGELDLLLGPFANAADAAVACLKLLDISGACRPAFFAGNELPSDQVQLEASMRF
ncbi:hypothetical protein [Roseibium litorale]|uniref:SPOR domain-containing protein n=1 Tax=Roseibium litorale TaxID=2803841 RepID=A0ABR9CIT9_9HYPH|nr:hypothetical protein [Roseibium litorale]MBD8890731.1 hypothetical protein [Roseibium litorale]